MAVLYPVSCLVTDIVGIDRVSALHLLDISSRFPFLPYSLSLQHTFLKLSPFYSSFAKVGHSHSAEQSMLVEDVTHVSVFVFVVINSGHKTQFMNMFN